MDDPAHNPFSPPKADVTPVEQPVVRYEAASRWRRLATFALDYVGFMMLAALLGIVLGLAGQEEWLDRIDRLKGWQENLFGVAIFLLYYMLTEVMLGRSLGKFIVGTRIIADDGRTPTRIQLVKRTLIRLVPFEMLSVFRDKAYMWHDSGSDTRVILSRGAS